MDLVGLAREHDIRASLGLGYSRSDYDTGAGSDAMSNDFHIGANASFGASDVWSRGFGTRMAASYSYQSFETERSIVVMDGFSQDSQVALSRTAKGDFDGGRIGAEIEFRYGFDAGTGPESALTIAPVVGMRFGNAYQEGYAETGAGGLGLVVSENSIDGYATKLGFEVGGVFAAGKTVFRPSASVKWVHEFGDRANDTTMELAGSPVVFVSSGPEAGSDSAELETALEMAVSDDLWLSASGNGTWADGSRSYGGNLRILFGF